MLKMMIRMNDDKITTEKKYHLDGIYSTINNTFLTMGLSRFEDGSWCVDISWLWTDRGFQPVWENNQYFEKADLVYG